MRSDTVNRRSLLSLGAGASLLLLCGASASRTTAAQPPSTELALFPSQVMLSSVAARQQLVAEQVLFGERNVADLSDSVAYSSSNTAVARVTTSGVVVPVGNGSATIRGVVGALTAQCTVAVSGIGAAPHYSFTTDVLPVLTRAGCNSGACHGALAGKGGLKLSLRGFDASTDYTVLTHQSMGRRVVTGRPTQSLMVLKPSMQIAHGGGLRLPPGSRDYNIVAGWVAEGAPPPAAMDAHVTGLTVYPSAAFATPAAKQHFVVSAQYSNGTSADVTPWVKFGSADTSVASVDDSGLATCTGHGQAAITVWYASKVTYARIVAPFTGPARSNHEVPVNLVDAQVQRKLTQLGIPSSPICTDAAFIRRAYLDAAGILPLPPEVRAFIGDTAPDKRARLIKSLLMRSEFNDYWTYRWCDLLLVSSKTLPGQTLTAFYNYIHQSVEQNTPWNQFVRQLLTARGSTLDNGAAAFYVLHKQPIDLTETTTQAFLGLSIQCARCHNHPLEKWTQRDYYQLANLYARVTMKNGDRPGEVLVLTSAQGDINNPRLGYPLPPRPLDGAEIALTDPRDRRVALADWVTSPQNTAFAKCLVNRVWSNFMGRGLVESVDDLRLTNPPTNQQLFDELAQAFVEHGYNVKWLIATIMNSNTYQRSSEPVQGNEMDDKYGSHYLVRRLPAEVILDAISQVTQSPTAFDGYSMGTRALQLKDSQVASYFLSAFGRPDRIRTCACERQQTPTVAQSLHLANGDTLNGKLMSPGGLISAMGSMDVDDVQATDDLYLAALSRPPTPEEAARVLPILESADTDPLAPALEGISARRGALQDLAWALLTSREFLFNH